MKFGLFLFTHATPRDLSSLLASMGTPIGRDAIATWLDDAGIRHRLVSKHLPGGEHADRDAQFCRIGELIKQYESVGMLFDTLDRVVELMRRDSTKTGLKTAVNLIRRLYETKRNATDEMKQQGPSLSIEESQRLNLQFFIC